MSWDPHVSNCVKTGAAVNPVCYAVMVGNKEKQIWGSYGTKPCWFNIPGLLSFQKPNSIKFGEKSFMFLNENVATPNLFAFNGGGVGAALYKGSTYTAFAVAEDKFKAEDCITGLQKLSEYMTSISYH